jgi:hypothetical protein
MKSVDEEVREPVKIDVENVASCLMKAYPNVNYVALNTALTVNNENSWRDHWYFIGFEKEPVYQELDGYPEWVADESIHTGDKEWGIFFMHISSKGHEFRGVPIQASRTDFASSRLFCWKREADGTMTQLIADEPEVVDDSEEFNRNFRDMLESTLLKPAIEALKPRGDEKEK